jgi:ParB family chromosome partitioning protein
MDEFLSVPLPLIFWKSPVREFSQEDIQDMAASIRIHGQIQPIVCKPLNEEGMYEGVVGRLRYEAAKYAMLPEVLVRVHKFEDEEEVLEWQLAENLHRKELNAIERSEAYTKLAELRKKRFPEEAVVKGIAMAVEELTGERPAEETVKKYLKISQKLKKKAKEMGTRVPPKKASKLGIKHLEQISRIEDEDRQAEFLRKAVERDWTVGKLKQEVDRELGLKAEPPKPIDTGLVVTCPECEETYTLIHVEEGAHRLQKIKVLTKAPR